MPIIGNGSSPKIIVDWLSLFIVLASADER